VRAYKFENTKTGDLSMLRLIAKLINI